jgi:hypothetical protein
MTQGQVLAVPDLLATLATLATEAVVHHLDMTVNLDAPPRPDVQAVALAAGTLDGLLDPDEPDRAEHPAGWTAEEYLLKGNWPPAAYTGRPPRRRFPRQPVSADCLIDTNERRPGQPGRGVRR